MKDLAGDKGRNAWKALTSGDLVSGDTAKRDAAVGDVAEGGKTLVETTKVGLETARDGQKYGSAFRAANKELKGLKAGQRLSIANNIAKNAFNKTDAAHVDGRPRNDLFKELKGDVRKHAVDTLLKDKGPNITTEARNQANTIVGHRSEKALKAGITAGSKAAGGPLAKAAGRFVPGANVAIAAFDVANAYKTLKDPKANGVKKTTAVFTALGSTVAATEIPVVSQVGAGVSAVSDLVGSIFG
ncbi:MAG: cell wall anchor protein [Myxococcaceae bacterium]|nr:cell wall anchor protein [Myxococcaceae bacterium]